MGCHHSKSNSMNGRPMGLSAPCDGQDRASSKEAEARSKQIGRQLKRDYYASKDIVKLLLLGAGESGKSTIVKQMKLLHPVNNRNEVGFSDEEKLDARIAIYGNIMDCMVALIDAVDKLKIGTSSVVAKAPADHDDDDDVVSTAAAVNGRDGGETEIDQRAKKTVLNYSFTLKSQCLRRKRSPSLTKEMVCESPPVDVVQALKVLWDCVPIQAAYRRANEFQLFDSAHYFLSDVERICGPGYQPTDQDVLRTRVATTGIVKVEFEYRHLTFNILDVGGQRSERKKWIHCFDDVTAVLFVISLSEYDQVLAEDDSVNRMDESLKLFDEMINIEYFHKTPFIVFFNKRDLFEEKVKRKSIKTVFPDYDGPEFSAEESGEFIIDKYINRSRISLTKRSIYTHKTTATDTQLVRIVFQNVAEIILTEILSETGLN